MSIYKELSYDQEIENVNGIQFNILGADEIVRRSVVEVTKTETYTGNEPVIGGLFDPRMGVLEHGKICATCEQKNTFCPGHFGHINLARSVYHPLFFDTVRKVLGCVCYRCSRLMVSPTDTGENYRDEIAKIMAIKKEQKRWDAIQKLCGGAVSKGKRCGFDGGAGCGAKQPSRYIKDSAMKIVAEWKLTGPGAVAGGAGGAEGLGEGLGGVVDAAGTTLRRELMAEDVLRIFKRITDTDCIALGFNPTVNRPEYMLWSVLPVPPPSVRPSIIEENGQRREDDLTHKLCDIVKTNNQLRAKMDKGNPNEEHLKLMTLALQYHIATFIDNQIPGLPPAQQRNGRKTKGLADRLKKKEGRIRGNLNGKRVDQSARSVITPDPYMSLDEVGMPIRIAMNTTFPETVNKYNIEEMRDLVRNGPDIWPGAKYVRSAETGVTKTLKNPNRDKVAEELRDGDIVDRHVRDGDFILFNRQPSLHKMSMMGHKVRVMPYQTFRLAVLATNPYNADFDGDEMNGFMTQSIQAMSELMDLAAVPYMMLAPRDGKPIILVIQDAMVGSYRMTNNFFPVSDKLMANLQMMNGYFNGTVPEPKGRLPSASGEPTEFFTGQQLFSQIFPPGLFLENGGLKVENSEIVKGALTKGMYHAISNGIIPVLFHDYGPFETLRFFNNMENMLCRWLMSAGFSVGISDLVIDRETNDTLRATIREMKGKAYSKIEHVRIEGLENNSVFGDEEFFEREISNILNETAKLVANIALDKIDPRTNRMINMVKSGSKGNDTNVAQMIACVGQQNVAGQRVTYGFTDRTLPHFCKFDDGPEARGFVENSFITGLTPTEVFFHAMGGREGLIDTAVKSVTGDTPIVVLENGRPRYVKIGDWIDGYLDKYASEVKHFAEREMEMLYINDAEKNPQKVYIPTGDEHGKTSWGELIAVTRHDPGTELYEITTEGGRKVIVTESKSLLVWKNDLCKFVETPTPEIVVGDFVPTVANLPEPPILTEFVDMKEYFPATEYVYGTEYNKACALMRAAQADRFHIPRGWWKDNNGVTFTIPYPSKARLQRATVRSNTENIRDGCVYPFHADRECARIPDRFDLNYENGVFIGLFLADGNTHLPGGSVSISKEEISVRVWVARWFEKHAITHRTVIEERESVTLTGEIMRGTTTSIIGNTTLLAIFLNKFVGEGSLNKYVPDVAFTAPKEFARGLLSGYFSGDGSVDKSGITAGSRSPRLIEGISMLCSRMGIFGKISVQKVPEISSSGFRSNGDNNIIAIRSLWARRFADEITLINKPKQDRLDVISTSKTHCNFPHFHDVVLDRIVDIQVFDANAYPKVYDVTVPSTLNFVLANGLNVRD